MASGVVKVGRRTYAVGLFWQPSPSGRVAQAAREAAQQPGQKADYYCVRAASKSVAVPQYGLGQNALSHKAGMPTLAASVANVQPGSWAGAFRLREGTWVIVVRDDLIAPDGDFLFDNDDQARERLLQEVSLGGVQRIYAPDGWAIPGSDPTPLPLLLQDRADCPLQPVQVPIKFIVYGLGTIAIIVFLVIMALQWQAEQERTVQEAQEFAKRVRGPIASQFDKWEWPPAEQVYEKVWEMKPLFRDAVGVCRELFTMPKVGQYGWTRNSTKCEGSKLEITLSRQRNKFDTGGIMPQQGSVATETTRASQTFSLPDLPARGPETLLNEKDVTQLIVTHGWPGDFVRLPNDPPKASVQPPPSVKDPPPPPEPLWSKRGIRYSGKTMPWNLFYYFDNVPGIIFEKVSWDGNTWTIEATLYEMKAK